MEPEVDVAKAGAAKAKRRAVLAALGLVGVEGAMIARPPSAAAATTPIEIADALGFWPVLSSTPPDSSTMYGKPVVWLEPTGMLTDIPAVPPEPAWNHATSRYTIPAPVVGVEYQNADTGAVLTQGTVIDVPAPLPQTVHVRAVALPGYTLSAPGSWTRYFYDPAVVTLLASDGFAGAAVTDILGRAVDMTLGGSMTNAPTWAATNAVYEKTTLGLDGAGHLIPTKEPSAAWGDTQNFLRLLNLGQKNLRIEVDVTQFSSSAGDYLALYTGYSPSESGLALTLSVAGSGVEFYVTAKAGNGGSVYLLPPTTVPTLTGTWTLDLVVDTKSWRVVRPDGTTQQGTYTTTTTNDPNFVAASSIGLPDSTYLAIRRSGGANNNLQLNGLKAYRIGA
jgi:hypothetical protein